MHAGAMVDSDWAHYGHPDVVLMQLECKMARTSLIAAALAALGPEKLAGLVFDEAERNAAFRKQVTAALTAAKGSDAAAKLIDRRLAALERARGFIDWDKAKAFQLHLAATVRTISDERLLRFIATHETVFERVMNRVSNHSVIPQNDGITQNYGWEGLHALLIHVDDLSLVEKSVENSGPAGFKSSGFRPVDENQCSGEWDREPRA